MWEGFLGGRGTGNSPRPIFCTVFKNPSLGQLGPLWPGLVQLSPQHAAAPRGSRCVADGRMACCEVPAFFFLLVKFEQQHDCIISSTYVTEQGSVFSEVSLFLFICLVFFFIPSKRTEPDLFWRCFWGNQPGTQNHNPEDRKLKSVQTAHNRYSASGGLSYIIIIILNTQH